MIQGRKRSPTGRLRQRGRGHPGHDRLFRLRLTLALSLGVAGSLLIFLMPAFYFLQQNYDIFFSLAYDTRPGLVSHLERELMWMRGFLILGFMTSLLVCAFFAWRLTRHLLNPLLIMEKHLQQLISGEWHGTTPDLGAEEGYRPLSLTYDYFYRSLRSITESELKALEKLNVDPAHREAYTTWKSLIRAKQRRLGHELTEVDRINENAAASSATPPLRRVS